MRIERWFQIAGMVGLAAVAGCQNEQPQPEEELLAGFGAKSDTAAAERLATAASAPLVCKAGGEVLDLSGKSYQLLKFDIDPPEHVGMEVNDLMTLTLTGSKGMIWVKDKSTGITVYRDYRFTSQNERPLRVDVALASPSPYTVYVYSLKPLFGSSSAKLAVSCTHGPALAMGRGPTPDNVSIYYANAFNADDHIMVGTHAMWLDDDQGNPVTRVAHPTERYRWQRLSGTHWVDYSNNDATILGCANYYDEHDRIPDPIYSPCAYDLTPDGDVEIPESARQGSVNDLVVIAHPDREGTYRLVLSYYHAVGGEKEAVPHQVTLSPVYYGARARQCDDLNARYTNAVGQLQSCSPHLRGLDRCDYAVERSLHCPASVVYVTYVPESAPYNEETQPWALASRVVDILPRMWRGDYAYIEDGAPLVPIAPTAGSAEARSCDAVLPCTVTPRADQPEGTRLVGGSCRYDSSWDPAGEYALCENEYVEDTLPGSGANPTPR